MREPIYSNNINEIFNLGISPLLADKHGGECVIVIEDSDFEDIFGNMHDLIRPLELKPDTYFPSGAGANARCIITLSAFPLVRLNFINTDYELDDLTPDTVVYHCDKMSINPGLRTRLDAYVNAKVTIRRLATRYGM